MELMDIVNNHSEWIVLSDKMINDVGYKSCRSNKSSNRSHLFSFIRKTYKKDEEYKATKVKVSKKMHERGGAQYKLVLEMTQSAYSDLLRKTHDLRTNKKKEGKHYVYVLHNPMFLYYGNNVYKIGYSANVERRVTGYSTGYIEESKIVYSRVVSSRECEQRLHKIMDVYRVNPKREFFNCPLEQVIKLIDTL